MIDQQMFEKVFNRVVTHNRKKHGRLTFTIEFGKGETYANRTVTVYAHDDYERSSVLSGRERRMWIGTFANEQDARDTMKKAGVMGFTSFMLEGGSTHVPVDQIVSHLPDDTDY